MLGEAKIVPEFKKVFIKVMRDENNSLFRGLRRCDHGCQVKPKVTVLNFSTIEIECCNHMGCMSLKRRGPEKYEDFCLRAINAWNHGEYDRNT